MNQWFDILGAWLLASLTSLAAWAVRLQGRQNDHELRVSQLEKTYGSHAALQHQLNEELHAIRLELVRLSTLQAAMAEQLKQQQKP
jgi:TolA-binding protein